MIPNNSAINQSIRRDKQQQRRMLSAKTQIQVRSQIASTLEATPVYQQAQHIALYLPVNGEADPQGLLTQPSSKTKQFYLPIVIDEPFKHLLFAPFNRLTTFYNNHYHIQEPYYSSDKLIKPDALDIVITPLVAFDYQGARLGMGGGYYDRTFSFKKHKRSAKPLLIGCAYPFQHSKELINQPWDVPLDALILANQFRLLTQ